MHEIEIIFLSYVIRYDKSHLKVNKTEGYLMFLELEMHRQNDSFEYQENKKVIQYNCIKHQ